MLNNVHKNDSNVSHLIVLVAKQHLYKVRCLQKKPNVKEVHTESNFIKKVELREAICKNKLSVADPGGAAGEHPPYGSRFFRFDIQIFRNVAASGVGAPPHMRSAPPLWEILDPLLVMVV